MTGRLIDADALKEKVPSVEDEYQYVHKLIDEAPTVDAEPVRHGKWIEEDAYEYGENVWRCSICGEPYVLMEEITPKQALYNYCPCCGAKMDAQEKEE